MRNRLRTVRWDGEGEAEALDSQSLPDNVGTLLGRGGKLFFDAYDEENLLYAAGIGADGAISLSEPVLFTSQWGALVEANGGKAYVSVGQGAIATYEFSPVGALVDLVEVMGSPLGIRFGSRGGYASLGYFGVVELPE